MFTLPLLLIVFVAHYVSDFVLQTRWMATNKSSQLSALTVHIIQYTLCLDLLCLIGFKTFSVAHPALLAFVLLNGLAHWLVDYVTSRLSKHWFETGQMHRFWMTIGADQLAHQVCLLGSLALFTG